MRDYVDYMNGLSVSAELHNRIVCRLQSKPRHRTLANRYFAAAACAVLLLISWWAAPQLFPAGGARIVKHELSFSPTMGIADLAKQIIPGYFTQQLTDAEATTLLPGLRPRDGEGYTLAEWAGFSGEGVPQNISFQWVNQQSNLTTNIHMRNSLADVSAFQYALLYADEPQPTDVNGTLVTAGYWEGAKGEVERTHFAVFTLGEIEYLIETAGTDAENRLEELVSGIIAAGPVDLSSIRPASIPKWREEDLSFAQAQNDPDFGSWVPAHPPAGFALETAHRSVGHNRDQLRVYFSNGMKYVSLVISRLTANDALRIVDLAKPETYNLALYPIPRAESVPQELREIVDNPIFRAEDLTLRAVQARSYTVNDAGDDNSGYRMHFSVLSGDIVLSLSAKGVQPEAMLDLLQEMLQGN